MEKNNMGIGILVTAFVAIIVGLALFSGGGGVAANVGTVTTLGSVANQKVTMPTAGSTLELYGQAPSGTPTVVNTTDGEAVPATNYTIAQGIGADGVIATILTSKPGPYAGKSINLSYSYEPDGYISNSQAGGRSVAGLIVIFAALAIAAVALWAVLGSKIRDYLDM